MGISPYKISKELEEKTKEMRQKKDILDKEMPSIDASIKLLENNKILNDEMKNLYDEVKKLYDDKKFIEAYDVYIKLKELLNKSLTSTIEENKKIIEKYIESLRSLEIDVSDLNAKLQKIYSAENLKEIKDEILKDSITLINKKIEEIMQKLPKNLSNEFIERAGNLISKLIDINEYSLNVLNDFKLLVYQYVADLVSKKIEKMVNLQEIYRRISPNISIFTIEQKKVNDLIQKNRHIEAIEELDSFNIRIEEQLVRILTEMVKNLSTTIKNSEKFGINPSNYEDKLQEIFLSINSGDYANSLSLIKDLTSKLSSEKIKIITERVSELSRKILDLMKQGENVKDLVTQLNKAKNLLENRELDEALEVLFEMEKRTGNVIELKKKLKQQLDELNSNIAYLKFLNVEIDKSNLKNIDEKIISDPENAKKILEDFIQNINEKAMNGRDSLVSKIKNFIIYLNQNGLNLENSAAKLNIISSYKPFDFLKNLKDFIDILRKEFAEKFNESLNEIEDKNSLNVMLEKFEKIKNDILNDIERMDFDSAKLLLDEYIKIKNSIKLQKLSEYYVKIKNVLETLNKLSFEMGDHSKKFDEIYESDINEELKKKYLNIIFSELNRDIRDIVGKRIVYFEKLINVLKDNNINIDYKNLETVLNDAKKESEITISTLQQIIDSENIFMDIFENSFTYLSTQSLLDKRIKKILNDDDKYNSVLSKYSGENIINSLDRIMEEFNYIISQNSFKNLEEIIKILKEIISSTGLYADMANDLQINRNDLKDIEILYDNVEGKLIEFRNHVFNSIMDIKIKLNKYKIEYLIDDLNKSIDFYSKGDYLTAYNSLKKINNEIEKISVEYDSAKKMLEDIYVKISFFKNVGLDLPKTYEFIKNLEELLKNGDLQKFKDYYRTNYLTVNDEITKIVKDFVDNVEKKINEKKNTMNTIIAEGLISSAKRTLRYDNPLDSFKQALEALENIKDVEMLTDVSEKLFMRMKEAITRFQSQPPKDFLVSFERINQLLNRGKYTASIIEMSDMLDKFEELSKKIKIIKDYIETLKIKINIATSIGAKVDKAVKMYQEARNSFQNGKIDESIEILEYTIDHVNVSIEKIIGASQITSKYIYSLSRILNENIDEIYNKLNELSSNIITSLLKLEDVENLNYLIIEFKQTNGELERTVNLKLFNILKSRLDSITYISKYVKTSSEDSAYMLYLWGNKKYQMIADIFSLVEYKNYKEYVKYVMDYVKDVFVSISRDMIYHPEPDAAIQNTLNYSLNIGIIPPTELNASTEKYRTKILEDIINSLNEKINRISKDIKDPEKLKVLKDLIEKRDFRNLEKKFVSYNMEILIMNSLRDIFKGRIEKMLKRIDELDRKNIDVFEEKKILNNIDFSAGYSYIKNMLDKIENSLNFKENPPVKNMPEKKGIVETKVQQKVSQSADQITKQAEMSTQAVKPVLQSQQKIEMPKKTVPEPPVQISNQQLKTTQAKNPQPAVIQSPKPPKETVQNKKTETLHVDSIMNIILKITLGQIDIPVNVSIKNISKNDIKNVKLRISGSLQPVEFSIDIIKSNDGINKIEKTKISKGDKLTLNIYYETANDKKSMVREINFRPLIDRGFRISKSSGSEICEICKKTIERNSMVLICNKCNSTYHYECAKKSGSCPKCGNKFYFEPTKDYIFIVKI